jgi:NADH:ubiquinone oxidoreductase subunit 6 (subunit J)
VRALKIVLAPFLAVVTVIVYFGAVALGRAFFDGLAFLLHVLAEWVAG